MSDYSPPLRDMRFCLHEMGLAARAAALPGLVETSPDLIDTILDESGKFASEVIAPLNVVGDHEGSTLENGIVRTPSGFADAYKSFVKSGWASLPFSPDHGGQGLPWLISAATQEMWLSANTAWSLCEVLTTGAVELLEEFGTDGQKALYLENLISGTWPGTMNLTEPEAGSDLGGLRCKADPYGDHYKIFGQKIFITYGEHDMAENIIHFVLARTPDAPEGPKGISLFIVPKFLVGPDGNPGERNDLRCLSLEEKLGIHGSPTCVMSYGNNSGAIGFLVGQENQGLAAMFTMMNNARLNIGISGLAIAERSYQQARDYAKERTQFGAIINHPDVRRMLMLMKSQIEAMRAVTYDAALALDGAKRYLEESERLRAKARVDLLIPMVKGWCTDLGVEISSLALQVHGGAGFITETGIAQHYRDARIAPIYEGTNGIQAIDLVGRKVLRDKGTAMNAFVDDARTVLKQAKTDGKSRSIVAAVEEALNELATTTNWLVKNAASDQAIALSGATAYLRLFGTVAGGVMHAQAAQIAASQAADHDTKFYTAKLASAHFYTEHVLPQIAALGISIRNGHPSIMALDKDQF
ncbi:acyl-CoA dehydrogenase [Alphaproteobacteria bacterium]|nr:acyl-CoA dehydrogenase [Alphaproteobacteria bacterium]